MAKPGVNTSCAYVKGNGPAAGLNDESVDPYLLCQLELCDTACFAEQLNTVQPTVGYRDMKRHDAPI